MIKIKHKRNRYQQGSLTIERRKNGADVWVYCWRDRNVRRKQIIGTTEQLRTRSAALREVDGLRLEINTESVSNSPMTVKELADHYSLIELADGVEKTALTKSTYRHHLSTQIVPKWGGYRIGDVKAFSVEAWLKELPHAPATKAKTRNVFSALYQHAIRYGWVESNPIRAVRQSSKRLREPDVLTPDELSSVFADLPVFCRAAVLIAATTGLRRGELFGLKWRDVDFEKRQVNVVRSVVDQVEGLPKTAGSARPLPIPEPVIEALQQWKAETTYKGDGDWIFASHYHLGQKALWPDAVLKRHILPAAREAKIGKRIGWHTFRRTFATLLASRTDVKTLQELMRHATPSVSLGIYAQAITEEKRNAQDRVAGLLRLPAA
jgi:integrase